MGGQVGIFGMVMWVNGMRSMDEDMHDGMMAGYGSDGCGEGEDEDQDDPRTSSRWMCGAGSVVVCTCIISTEAGETLTILLRLKARI